MLLKCVNKQSIPLRSVFQRNIKTSSIQFCDHEKQGQDEKSDKKLDVEEISKKEKNLYEHLEVDPSGNLFRFSFEFFSRLGFDKNSSICYWMLDKLKTPCYPFLVLNTRNESSIFSK